MIEDVVSRLRRQLTADVKRIHVSGHGASAAVALQRLQAVAEHSPAILGLLAEPWIAGMVSEEVMAVLLHCARIHLYARVLDDAVDECLPVHRLNLLRAQPMYWEAVQGIGALASRDVSREAVQLVAETVAAVQLDDRRREPAQWGAKNHHLLLVPLLLSGGSASYRTCRAGLSTLIALIQAGDEWRQFELDELQRRDEFLSFLCGCLDNNMLGMLSAHGWRGAAERIVWNARQLLAALSA